MSGFWSLQWLQNRQRLKIRKFFDLRAMHRRDHIALGGIAADSLKDTSLPQKRDGKITRSLRGRRFTVG